MVKYDSPGKQYKKYRRYGLTSKQKLVIPGSEEMDITWTKDQKIIYREGHYAGFHYKMSPDPWGNNSNPLFIKGYLAGKAVAAEQELVALLDAQVDK